MWHGANKAVRPVIAAESDLFAGSELERAVRAEVHEGIGSESVACPQIGRDVIVKRRRFGTVHDFEIIVAKSGGCLGNKHDIAEPEPCEGEISIFISKTVSGESAVDSLYVVFHLF